MRDMNKVILAEDDRDRAWELRSILQGIGAYDVSITHRVKGVMPLLRSTAAYWLILDMELEDGSAEGLIPEIRKEFGSEVFILVLTGRWERYTEGQMLGRGADLLLRKPYEPASLVAQMARFKTYGSGAVSAPTKGRKVEVDGVTINLDTGYVRSASGSIVRLSTTLQRLVNILAERWLVQDGAWGSWDRGDLITRIWGDAVSDDMETSGTRLRRLVNRLRTTMEELGVTSDFVVVDRGADRAGLYRFADGVVLSRGEDG